VYAAYLAYTDHEIGRVIQAVQDLGKLDNTLIIYISGDNGASAEGTLTGTPNEVAPLNGAQIPLQAQLLFYEFWGSDKTYPHMAVPWAWAFDTPFQWVKQVASHFGGTRQGVAMSWPARIKDAGGIRTQFHHIIDIVPTILEAARIPAPCDRSSTQPTTGCITAGPRKMPMFATPVAYFAAHELGCGSAVAVTGSHNPPEYNGLKMVLAGTTLAGETIQRLRRRIETGDLARGAGRHRRAEIREAYLARIASDVRLARPMKIAVDCGNGVAGATAGELYRRLGCEVFELYCDVDGRFPNHHPDPSHPENLKDLIALVRKERAEIGFAFDGDGDRLGVVTSEGQIIYPDRQLMLFAKDVLSRQPGAEIIYDIKSTRNLAPWIRKHGGVPSLWKTGHSLIKARMRERGAALAGEMSGHVFFVERWFGFDDAQYAGARLLEILSKTMDASAMLNACGTLTFQNSLCACSAASTSVGPIFSTDRPAARARPATRSRAGPCRRRSITLPPGSSADAGNVMRWGRAQ